MLYGITSYNYSMYIIAYNLKVKLGYHEIYIHVFICKVSALLYTISPLNEFFKWRASYHFNRFEFFFSIIENQFFKATPAHLDKYRL